MLLMIGMYRWSFAICLTGKRSVGGVSLRKYCLIVRGQIFFGVWHRYRPLFFGMTEVMMISRRSDMLLSIGLELLLSLLFMMCADGQGTKAVGKNEA